MFARILAVVGLVSLSSLMITGSPVAHAAGYAGWHGNSVQSKRPQFRPWRSRSENRAQAHWRPHGTSTPPRSTARYPSVSRQPILLTGETRYAPAVSRGLGRSVNTDARFRPNVRSVGAAGSTATEVQARQPEQIALHAQFRPRPTKKRPTYEQLQGDTSPTQAWSARDYPGRVFPGMTAPLTLPGAQPPHWNVGW